MNATHDYYESSKWILGLVICYHRFQLQCQHSLLSPIILYKSDVKHVSEGDLLRWCEERLGLVEMQNAAEQY